MAKKVIATLSTAAVLCTLAACSEGEAGAGGEGATSATSVITTQPPEPTSTAESATTATTTSESPNATTESTTAATTQPTVAGGENAPPNGHSSIVICGNVCRCTQEFCGFPDQIELFASSMTDVSELRLSLLGFERVTDVWVFGNVSDFNASPNGERQIFEGEFVFRENPIKLFYDEISWREM
jgi:hypothetical protein